jgi:membrane-associated phospholipid phosphatase
MPPRRLLYWFFGFLIATVVAIFLVDGPVAVAMQDASPGLLRAIGRAVTALEIVFGFPISKYLSGAVVVLIGIVLAPFARHRPLAWSFAFVGLSQLTTRLVAGVLKTVFGRLRPYETLADGVWNDAWFVDDGNAFPSGHAAHFWGFWFALALLLPRWRWPLLLVPVFTSFARVAVNDHYVGDVLGSAAVAALLTLGYARMMLHKCRSSSAVPS